MNQFGKYLDEIISSRKKLPLRPSSKATYRSSITMILSTYMYYRTERDVFNGHLDDVLALERKHGNNANYSMQSCAIRHFKDFILMRRPPSWSTDVEGTNERCATCLCGCPVCHPRPGECRGVVECFGKCGKLYSTCRMRCENMCDAEDDICRYCVLKYSPLFDITRDEVAKKRRARHVEYVNDHALVGRTNSVKYPELLRREIRKNCRWHESEFHRCEHPLCGNFCVKTAMRKVSMV